MPIQYDTIFDDPNIVKYSSEKADGSSEIVCNRRFAQSIIDHFKAAFIPSGLAPDQPAVGACTIIVTSSMVASRQVKDALKQWMTANHVGDLASVK